MSFLLKCVVWLLKKRKGCCCIIDSENMSLVNVCSKEENRMKLNFRTLWHRCCFSDHHSLDIFFFSNIMPIHWLVLCSIADGDVAPISIWTEEKQRDNWPREIFTFNNRQSSEQCLKGPQWMEGIGRGGGWQHLSTSKNTAENVTYKDSYVHSGWYIDTLLACFFLFFFFFFSLSS